MDKKKIWYIYTLGYYSTMRREDILPFATTWVDLGHTVPSKIRWTETDKYYVISLICGTLKKLACKNTG